MNTKELIKLALIEDAFKKDITTRCIEGRNKRVLAAIVSKSSGIVCGVDVAASVFRHIGKTVIIRKRKKDCDKIKPSDILMEIKAPASVVLAGERTALNFLQHLSGIATLTGKYVEILKKCKSRIKIYDTRKTIPLLRGLEKYAVRCGGGYNHRMDLSEMALIKDNHLKITNNLSSIVNNIRSLCGKIKIEVECQNLKQVEQAAGSGADIIMLDNMKPRQLKKAISFIRKRCGRKTEIEISGGVTLGNIRKIARLDADRISVGALTHSAPALDISLEIIG